MSNTYVIRWRQVLQEDFEVEAETPEEAIKLVSDGECGDVMNIIDNEYTLVREGGLA